MTDSTEQQSSAHDKVSKSQRKRDSNALQVLAAELVKLSHNQLESLKLEGELTEALEVARSIKKTSAQQRQIKFIGGLLRRCDASPIYDGLNTLKNQNAEAHRLHHTLEKWRDRLLSEGKIALTELLQDHPTLDAQKLRQLIRAANNQTTTGKAPSASRALYRYLRDQFN